MGEPKNHHYIPQSYLRNFSTERKGQNYINVRYKGKKFHETNIRNICSENYFYSIPGIEDSSKNSIEKFYSKDIDSFYPEITDIVTNDEIKSIDDTQREKIVSLVLNLYFRTPTFLRYYEKHIEDIEKMIDDYHLGKSERYKIDFFGKTIDFRKIDYKTFKENIKDKGKQLFLSDHIKLFNEFVGYKKNDGIGITKIEDSSKYITSDNPVIIRNALGDASNIFSKDNVIHLPINEKYLITLIPKNESSLKGTFHRISGSIDDVTGINFDIEKNSSKWIIGSKDGIDNHLEHVNSVDNDPKTGEEFKKRTLAKAKVMQGLIEILEKNNGNLTQELLDALQKVSEDEYMKDDVNLIRFLKSLKQAGMIK